jgi:hypothetical protein
VLQHDGGDPDNRIPTTFVLKATLFPANMRALDLAGHLPANLG